MLVPTIFTENMPQSWRRVVFIRWKPSASHAEVARAMNLHRGLVRAVPAVLSVTEGFTFTSVRDGAGAYPGVADGRQNKIPRSGGLSDNADAHGVSGDGFDSCIEIILSCATPDDVLRSYFQHPAHIATATAVDPLILETWAMDWIEDRDALRVPASSQSVMKHVCFFKWHPGTTAEQQVALFDAWKSLTESMSHCISVSCGEAVRWSHGENRGFHAGLVVDLALASGDGVDEIGRYAFSKEYQSINEKFLAPIRKDYGVMDYAVHGGHGMGSGTTSKL